MNGQIHLLTMLEETECLSLPLFLPQLRLYSLLSFCLVLSLLRPIFPGRRNFVQAFKATGTEGTVRELKTGGGNSYIREGNVIIFVLDQKLQ